MKLKQSPADFRVYELLDFESKKDGRYYVHRVRKERMDTPEALDKIARHASVHRKDLAYAGLKDRQAITEQFVSIAGKRCEFEEDGLRSNFVGRSDTPIHSKMSRGNRFTIVVRDLAATDAAKLRRNKRSVEGHGLPNYFDDQRFGCLMHGQGLVALALAKGEHEQALKRLIAMPDPTSQSDRGGDAKLRRILNHRWGDWQTCGEIARGPMYDAIFSHLHRTGDDFLGCFEHVPMRLKLIHLYAFQSMIWNRAVSRFLREHVRGRERVFVSSLVGDLLCWRYLDEGLKQRFEALSLPLIDAKTTFEDESFGAACEAVLEDFGIRQEQLASLDSIPGMALKEEPRALVLRPDGFQVEDPEPDDRNKGRLKAVLRFALPRGAYATLCVRRTFCQPVQPVKQLGFQGAGGPGGGRPYGREGSRDGGYRQDRGGRGDYRDRGERYGRGDGGHRGERGERREGGYRGHEDRGRDRHSSSWQQRDQRDHRDDRRPREDGREGRERHQDRQGGGHGHHHEGRSSRGGWNEGRDRRDNRDSRGDWNQRRDRRDDRPSRGDWQEGRGRHNERGHDRHNDRGSDRHSDRRNDRHNDRHHGRHDYRRNEGRQDRHGDGRPDRDRRNDWQQGRDRRDDRGAGYGRQDRDGPRYGAGRGDSRHDSRGQSRGDRSRQGDDRHKSRDRDREDWRGRERHHEGQRHEGHGHGRRDNRDYGDRQRQDRGDRRGYGRGQGQGSWQDNRQDSRGREDRDYRRAGGDRDHRDRRENDAREFHEERPTEALPKLSESKGFKKKETAPAETKQVAPSEAKEKRPATEQPRPKEEASALPRKRRVSVLRRLRSGGRSNA